MDKKFVNHIDVLTEEPNKLEDVSIGLDTTNSFEEMYILIKKQDEILGEDGNDCDTRLIVSEIEAVV